MPDARGWWRRSNVGKKLFNFCQALVLTPVILAE
jgi:hypothetical protein